MLANRGWAWEDGNREESASRHSRQLSAFTFPFTPDFACTNWHRLRPGSGRYIPHVSNHESRQVFPHGTAENGNRHGQAGNLASRHGYLTFCEVSNKTTIVLEVRSGILHLWTLCASRLQEFINEVKSSCESECDLLEGHAHTAWLSMAYIMRWRSNLPALPCFINMIRMIDFSGPWSKLQYDEMKNEWECQVRERICTVFPIFGKKDRGKWVESVTCSYLISYAFSGTSCFQLLDWPIDCYRTHLSALPHIFDDDASCKIGKSDGLGKIAVNC